MSAIAERPSNIYADAYFGEPLGLPVRQRTLNTERSFWTVGDWTLILPRAVVRRAPEVQRMMVEVRGWTGWSARQLAAVLGTSHTTVLNAEAGRPLIAVRSGDLRRRVGDLHDLVQRVHLLANREPSTTADVLATTPAAGRSGSPLDALAAGYPDRAYLAAIDVLRPRPNGLLTGSRPRRSGATAALHD